MFVIIQTYSQARGDDSITAVYGPYESRDEALDINAQLRAFLPAQYASHEDNPVDYGVWEVQPHSAINNTEEVI